MKKLVFCCLPGLTNFIEPIAAKLAGKFKLDIAVGNSIQDYGQKIHDADIIWLEWANQLAAAITTNLLPLEKAKKVIMRLHSYEAITPGMLEQINYGAITDLVFVSEFVRDYTIGLSPKTFEHLKIHTIPNGLDLSKFDLLHDKGKPEAGYTAALLGHLNTKKGPMLLAQAMYELKRHIGNINFKIGGQWQDQRHEAYMMHFLEKTGMLMDVEFVDVPYGQAPAFFKDVDLVLCSSPWESQNMSVMEGMASGCKPAIHWFPGADYHYELENLWLTIDELISIFKQPWKPESYREQVARFDLDKIVARIESELLI